MSDALHGNRAGWSRAVAGVLALIGTCKIFAAMPLEPVVLAQAGETEFFSELPVVLSVTRLPQSLKDAPGFVSVIDADDIRYSGARDLADLLRTVPGFSVAFSPDGAPGATYHGLAEDFPKGLQVLVNGRSQYSPLFQSGVSWNLIDIPLADIARIEVLRGSNSPAYGSNAFMGVINIVTRHAAETRGGMVSVNEGNAGIRDSFVRFGFGSAGWNGRLSAEKLEDDGLQNFHDSRLTERYNLQLDADPGSADNLRFAAGLLRLSQQRGDTTNVLNPERWVDAGNTFAQLDWGHRWGEHSTTEFSLHHIRQTTEDSFEVAEPKPAPLFTTRYSENGVAERDEVSLQQTLLLSQLRLLGGLSYRNDEVNHDRNYGVGREVRQWVGRAFGQLEWRPNERATLNLGATYEDDSISGESLLPRVALNFHPVTDQTIKLIVGKSRRNPTLYESRGDERLYQKTGSVVAPAGALIVVEKSSSGRVQPTEVTSRELGYFGEFRKQGVTIDARIFKEDVEHWIRPAQVIFPASAPGSATCPIYDGLFEGYPPCGVYEDFFNQLRAQIRGWETQIIWRPAKTSQLGFSYAGMKIDVDWTSAYFPQDPDTIRYIEESAPRHSTAVWGRHRLLERITLSGGYYRVGNMRWTRNTQAGEYHRFDWRIGYDFKLGPSRAELAWTVRSDGADHAENRGFNREGQPLAKPETLVTQHFATLRVEF